MASPSIIATLFIPPVILLIPNYLIVGRLGWLDTLLAVVVPGAAGAFGVFFLRQFFLVAADRAGGGRRRSTAPNRWRTFWKVILPLSRPALVTLALLAFLTNWNDFLWPVYVLFSPENQTLTVGPGDAAERQRGALRPADGRRGRSPASR